MYRLNFNSNTGDIHVIGNLIEYKLGGFHCEGESCSELDVLCDDLFVVFLNEKFKLNIKDIINKNDVVLFMKGTPEMPQCGFSMTVSNILKKLNVKFSGIDVLADPEIRQGIKDFSNWPTVPQLYIKGEFIGGCDIAKEMYEKGELQKILK